MSPPKSGCPSQVAFEKIAVEAGEHDGTRGRPAGVDLDVPRGVRLYLDPFAPNPCVNRSQDLP